MSEMIEMRNSNFDRINEIYTDIYTNDMLMNEFLWELEPLCHAIIRKYANGCPVEDFTQELLMFTIEVIPHYDGRNGAKFTSFLYRVLINKTHQLRKKWKKLIIVEEVYEDAELAFMGEPATHYGIIEFCHTAEERKLVETLLACNGNKSEASRVLGVNRKTVGRRFNKILERYCEDMGIEKNNIPKY